MGTVTRSISKIPPVCSKCSHKPVALSNPRTTLLIRTIIAAAEKAGPKLDAEQLQLLTQKKIKAVIPSFETAAAAMEKAPTNPFEYYDFIQTVFDDFIKRKELLHAYHILERMRLTSNYEANFTLLVQVSRRVKHSQGLMRAF